MFGCCKFIGSNASVADGAKGLSALEIKTFLWTNGLTVSDIARGIEPEYEATFDSLRTMLTDLFYHGKWNAKLAAIVAEKYDLTIARPDRPQSVAEAVRLAA